MPHSSHGDSSDLTLTTSLSFAATGSGEGECGDRRGEGPVPWGESKKAAVLGANWSQQMHCVYLFVCSLLAGACTCVFVCIFVCTCVLVCPYVYVCV